jgi:hypothetical protein
MISWNANRGDHLCFWSTSSQIQPTSILFSFANITPLPPLVRVVKMLPAGSIMYQGECGRIVAIAYLHIRAFLHVKA